LRWRSGADDGAHEEDIASYTIEQKEFCDHIAQKGDIIRGNARAGCGKTTAAALLCKKTCDRHLVKQRASTRPRVYLPTHGRYRLVRRGPSRSQPKGNNRPIKSLSITPTKAPAKLPTAASTAANLSTCCQSRAVRGGSRIVSHPVISHACWSLRIQRLGEQPLMLSLISLFVARFVVRDFSRLGAVMHRACSTNARSTFV
jgi:hypothetical protein